MQTSLLLLALLPFAGCFNLAPRASTPANAAFFVSKASSLMGANSFNTPCTHLPANAPRTLSIGARERVRVLSARPQSAISCNAEEDNDELGKEFNELLKQKKESGELSEFDAEMDMFNREVYEELRQSTGFDEELKDKEMIQSLQEHIDYNEAMQSSLQDRTLKIEPEAGQTPGEVIETVLYALQGRANAPDVEKHVAVLMNYCSTASAASRKYTSEQPLSKYIADSKYRILMDWDQVMFSKKIDVNLDGNKAYQEVRLRSALNQQWVTINFMLSKYKELWLIESFRVKENYKG